jgi:FG-GAP-like repeat
MRKDALAAIVCLMVLGFAFVPAVAGAGNVDAHRAFGFGDREIYEFKKNTSRLVFHDINRDGLDDILFLNNRMSRIEVLLRKALVDTDALDGLPALEDVFVSVGFLLDQKTSHLRVLDLNGDQRPDILTAGTHRGLRVYFQNSEGRFGNAAGPAVKRTDQIIHVATADFDNDGGADILVCRRKNAELLYNDRRGHFRRRLTLEFTAPDCEGLMLGDFNGDDRQDILLRFPEEQLPLRLFLGRPEGGFGWEHPLDTPPLRALKSISLIDQKNDQLLAILKNAVNIRHYQLRQDAPGDIWGVPKLTATRLVARGLGGKIPMSWAMADFNRDGRQDYCVSAPELSRIMVHFGGEQGVNPVPQEVSSLRRIKTLGVDSRGDLYVFSPAENAIACHPSGAVAAFPTFVDLEGSPLMMDVSPWRQGVFSIVKGKRDRLYFSWSDRHGAKRAVLMDIPADQPPEAMRVFPVSKDRWGVVLFSPLKKPAMHLWNGRKLEPVTKKQLRALGAGLTTADISMVGTAADPGVIISEGQAARLYRFNGKQFEIVRQFSLPDENAVLKFGVMASGPDGLPGYLFYNKNGNELCWFPEDETRETQSVAFADEFPGLGGIVTLATPKGHAFLLPGKSETRWVRADAETYTLKTLSGYTSRAEDPKLWALYPLALGTPPRPMAAALDAKNASIELLSAQDGKLTEEVSFKIFQGPQFNRDEERWYYEPREVASGDLNADGLMDLGFLVHDKLVIHLGE